MQSSYICLFFYSINSFQIFAILALNATNNYISRTLKLNLSSWFFVFVFPLYQTFLCIRLIHSKKRLHRAVLIFFFRFERIYAVMRSWNDVWCIDEFKCEKHIQDVTVRMVACWSFQWLNEICLDNKNLIYTLARRQFSTHKSYNSSSRRERKKNYVRIVNKLSKLSLFIKCIYCIYLYFYTLLCSTITIQLKVNLLQMFVSLF